MNRPLVVQPATLQDAAQIAALHDHSWQAIYAHVLPIGDVRSHLVEAHVKLWRDRLMRADDPALRIWKACPDATDGPLAGFVCALSGADGILLDNLHVAPAWQGRGIGRALFARARDWARVLDSNAALYLWTLAQNVKARRFYERLGGVAGTVHPIAISPGIEVPALRYVWRPERRDATQRTAIRKARNVRDDARGRAPLEGHA